MTTFRQRMEMAAHTEGPYVAIDAVVDTGAFYTWVPRPTLEGLGITPHDRRSFILANGKHLRRDLGRAWVRLDGRQEMTLVVFGDVGSLPLLGAYTLEAFALAVDPVNQRLVPIPALYMLAAGLPNLASRRCLPCEGGTPPLAEEAARAYLAQLGDGGPDLHRGTYRPWELAEGRKIVKGYRLKSFRGAMAFVNRVADLAEAEGHHPDIWISWRRVRIELTTHAIGGLSENDFIMAAKIDQLEDQGQP